MPERSSDVIEHHSEKGITFGLLGLASLAIAGFLNKYRGDGYTLGLIWVLAIGGVISVFYALYAALLIPKVPRWKVRCPYCEYNNDLTENPTDDVTCHKCQRLIPIRDGHILSVSKVRCGYCNSLNFYSEKTEVLLCEDCNREVPIFHEDGHIPKQFPKGFARQDDDNLYELVLVAPGNKTEELIGCLQHMLALNRKQVKLMLEEAPVTLLTGITRKKAEMLTAQLTIHDAAAEYRPLG